MVGSVAITSNCAEPVPDPVEDAVRNPVVSILMFAFVGEMLQFTESVMSTCLPLAVPSALNCSVPLQGMLVFPSELVTLIDVKPPKVTVMVALPGETAPDEPLMVACPGKTPVTRPLLLTEAMLGSLLLQYTPDEIVCVVPSL